MKRGEAGLLLKRCEYLNSADKHVFLTLLEGAHNLTCEVPADWTPTVATLVAWTSLSRSTVQRALGHLEVHGWVELTRGRGRGIRSRYWLVQREPDSTCDCQKVSPRTPLRIAKGVTETQERCPTDPEKVSRDLESTQVATGIARRDAGTGGMVSVPLRPCDQCDSTDTRLIGPYRLCRAHAGATWKDPAA